MNKLQYIQGITEAVSAKGTCDRAKVGAVFVNEELEILATGYNSSPIGFPTCDKEGHEMINEHCIRTIHGELNAILQAAKRGVPLKNSILFCTHSPCEICARHLVNLKIKQVYAKQIYSKEERKY